MTGSVPTSYIEITGYPEAGPDPQAVDFVVSYGFVTSGGEEAIGHLKTKLVNIRPGTVTGAAAPGPVPPGPVGDAALGDFPPPPGGFCVDTVPVPYPVCWTVHLTNQSVNLPGTVAQCSMDWGDGTPIQVYVGSSPQCQTGYFFTHIYANHGAVSHQDHYNVVLTNTFNNGAAPKTYVYAINNIPY